MDFQYKLIVGNQTFYKEFEIPAELERVKLGSTSNCEFRLNSDFFFEDIEISLEKKENWNILCSDNLYISRGDVRKLLFSELTHDDVVNICYVNSGEVAFEIRFLIDFGSDGTDYSLKIDLSQISELSIGDKSGANIELSTEYGKDTFVSIVQANNKIELIEKASKYGTYVNGKRISKKAVLKDFDFISVADFSAYYKDKQLYFSKRNIRLNGISQIVEQVDIGGVYPMFIRNTRAKSVIEDEKIKILDPDTIPTKPELNIVTSLMPTIVMFALVVVLRGIMSESGGTYVIFSICSMGMGVITSVLNIVHGQNKYKKDCEKRRNVYLNYVAKKKEEIIAARNSELEILRDTYYSTEENLEHIESFSAELFDRTPEDEDFLDIYLGVGKREAERKIEYKEQEKLDTGDDLCQIPTQLSEEYKYIDNAPIYIKAKDANAIGIIGRKERQNEFIKCLLIDIISRQYFGDVNVYAFIDDNVQEYDWLKLIPHIQPNPNFRNIVCDTESKNIVFEYLYKELTYRSEHKGVPGHNVIFILNDNGIKSHPISRFIEHASELNTTFIFFETEKKYLPLYCSQIVVLEENYSAYTYASENKTDKTEFKYACVSSDKVQRAIDILAPVYCEEISLESSLRKNISLFELLGIYSANDLELKTRWNDSKIYETMAVPLGINVKNDVVCLNLHEKFHGPHGLVVVIDNLTALKELYLQDNDMLLPVCRDGNSVGISFLVANGQTAGVGYRYLNNFEGRIALFCNESSEYTMLFEGNRTKLPNVPGRALVQIDKATYECQMYLAFDGDKEYERVQNIQKYVTSCNERYVGMNARVIPEIPKCLDIGYVEKHYAQANTNDELMIGLDYETIEPLSMNLNENDMIVLSGKKDVSRKAFAKYIISVFADKKFGKTELYVLDTLAGKWGELEILPQTAYYTTDADSSISIVTEIGQIVEQRYQNYINRRSNLQDESWIVVIVDNNDAILALSSNKNAMATLKDIWGKYSGMKVIFVFTDINNASIPFNAPEIMKIIKERKKYIIFDEISNIKTTDIPLSLTRKYSKPLETGDAYLVEDGDVKKIRTIN